MKSGAVAERIFGWGNQQGNKRSCVGMSRGISARERVQSSPAGLKVVG